MIERSKHRQMDALLDVVTLAVLLVRGEIHINLGPKQHLKNQMQIITQNSRVLIVPSTILGLQKHTTK